MTLLFVFAVVGTIALVFGLLYRSGSKTADELLRTLDEMAARRGLTVRVGSTAEDFAASGTTRGIALHIERHFLSGGGGNDDHGRHREQALVRGKPLHALPSSLVLPRAGVERPAPPVMGFFEIEPDGGAFDAMFRTLAADEGSVRASLDPRTREGLMAFGSRAGGGIRLGSLKCSAEEVVLMVESSGIPPLDAQAVDRGVDLVLALCA